MYVQAPPKLKDKPLTENQLNTIALHNVYDWEVLARTLGLTDIQIKDIDSDYKQSSISKKCAMLNVWRQMYDDQATIQRLLDALCNMGRKADATKVLRRLGMKSRYIYIYIIHTCTYSMHCIYGYCTVKFHNLIIITWVIISVNCAIIVCMHACAFVQSLNTT